MLVDGTTQRYKFRRIALGRLEKRMYHRSGRLVGTELNIKYANRLL